VEVDVVAWDAKFLLKPLDKPREMLELPISEPVAITISNEANANGVLIMVSAGFANHVGSWKLFNPAIPNVNLAVGESIAIADEEVIAESLVAP